MSGFPRVALRATLGWDTQPLWGCAAKIYKLFNSRSLIMTTSRDGISTTPAATEKKKDFFSVAAGAVPNPHGMTDKISRWLCSSAYQAKLEIRPLNTEILNIIALMSALALLYLCTLICAISYHRQWTPAWHQFWLSFFGIFPGMAGALAGFWLFSLSHELNLILPASILLEFGAFALLSLKKDLFKKPEKIS